MSKPLAGWYPSPDDSETQKYWDGEKWLDIPAPSGHRKARRRISKRAIIILSAIFVVVAAGTTGAVLWKAAIDRQQAEEEKAAAEEEQAREEEAEAARVAAEEEADEIERAMRKSSVKEIEDSVKKMAEGHVSEGLLTGPIISVSCNPVGGGSTDDLDQSTTVFDCFAANKDNGDGTHSGYSYNATMNWDTGQFTYSLGSP